MISIARVYESSASSRFPWQKMRRSTPIYLCSATNISRQQTTVSTGQFTYLVCVQECPVAEHTCHIRMHHAQSFFCNIHRPCVHRSCLLKFSLTKAEWGELSYLLAIACLYYDRGPVVPAYLALKQRRMVVHHTRQVRMVWSDRGHPDRDRIDIKGIRFFVLAL